MNKRNLGALLSGLAALKGDSMTNRMRVLCNPILLVAWLSILALPVAGQTWTTKATMPTPRNSAAYGVINNVLYVAGGDVGCCGVTNVLEAYDPVTNSWTTKAPMPTARGELSGGAIGNTLYVVSGACAQFASCLTAEVDAYNTITDTWSLKAPIPTARRFYAAGVVNGILYVAGGFNPSATIGTVEAYDPTSDSWTARASMPVPVGEAAAAVVNNIFYVIGGPGSATVQAYDPATDTWIIKSSMPTPRELAAASVINGIIYVAGGNGAGGQLSTVEAYDPATDTWTSALSMPTARHGPAAGEVGNVLYVVGGWDGGSNLGVNEAFAPLVAQIQPPINADGTSVFKARRGIVPVKFTLTSEGSATCNLPPATISIFRISGGNANQVNESTYSMPADTGSDFRIDLANCQYIYNVSSAGLGPGMYLVEININGLVAGSATFVLQ